MATNQSRSMTGELAEGMSDGKYKKLATDRGGSINEETYESRRDLGTRFDITEAKDKVLGDGSIHQTPDFAVARQLTGGVMF